jgi:hypothetical protein
MRTRAFIKDNKEVVNYRDAIIAAGGTGGGGSDYETGKFFKTNDVYFGKDVYAYAVSYPAVEIVSGDTFQFQIDLQKPDDFADYPQYQLIDVSGSFLQYNDAMGMNVAIPLSQASSYNIDVKFEHLYTQIAVWINIHNPQSDSVNLSNINLIFKYTL